MAKGKRGRMTLEDQERAMEYAKLLYTRDNITSVKALSERTGIGEKTLSGWVADGNWKKLARNFVLTREEQMANLLDELAEINDAIRKKPKGERYAGRELAQIRRQLIKDIKDLETRAMLPEIINSLTQFLDYVRRENLSQAQDISRIIDHFIKTKLK